MQSLKLFQAVVAVALLQTAACDDLDYEPMSFTVSGSEIIARGVIDGSTLNRFLDVSEANSNLSVLVLEQVDGSADDVANLELSRVVRAAGFTTVVPSNGLVASGGTDLFLAGATRTLENGACVGVHSWSGGDIEGHALSRNDPEHRKYLSYYQEMGTDPEFYWFTLEAAPANGMHWMTASEASRFNMASSPVTQLGPTDTCDER